MMRSNLCILHFSGIAVIKSRSSSSGITATNYISGAYLTPLLPPLMQAQVKVIMKIEFKW